jgi:hypothetical protein
MEDLNQYTEEPRCPYHQQNVSLDKKESADTPNTGDWEDHREDSRTEPERYDSENPEEGGNDNSGGAGSSGSAATNS